MKVHQQGGVLAGCSAGAMIMGKGFPGFPRWQNAFGLLDDVIIVPHFDELPSLFVNSMRRLIRNGNTVLGIEGSTALIADGQRRFVRGKGGVTVLHAKGTQRFIDGQEILPLL
jgi:cyanophycinase-like exopeptidase